MSIAGTAKLWAAALICAAALLATPASAQDVQAQWEAHMREGGRAYGLAQMEIAARELDAALVLAEKNFSADDVKMISTWLNIVPLRRAQSRLDEAVVYGEKLLAAVTKVNGADSPELMAPLTMMATTYRDLGDFAASDKAYLRTIALHEKFFGDSHPRTVTMLEDRAVMLGRAGRLEEGVKLFEEVVELWKYGLGMGHLREAISRRGYAEALRKMGREADATAQETLANQIAAFWEAGR